MTLIDTFCHKNELLFDGTDEFRYDNAFNRLVSSTIHYPLTGGPGRDDRSYTYDRYGNLTTISSSANPRILSPDPATNRLESPFTYDAAGNLTSQPGWDAAGNLTSQPGWDAAGNPIGPPDWYYTYDPFNMMTRARNASGSVTREYLYTADDERLAVLTPGRELWTLRGPDARVLRDVEYLSTGWRWVEDYIHRGSGLLATLGDVTGERHQHLDHLGSPRLVTDPTGQVLARHVHAPYGEELTAANQDELRMKFTGHERDELDSFGAARDLDYMHARTYSQLVSRFLSVDPISSDRLRIPQSWNKYAYGLGSPMKFVDPNGRYLIPASGVFSENDLHTLAAIATSKLGRKALDAAIFSRSLVLLETTHASRKVVTELRSKQLQGLDPSTQAGNTLPLRTVIAPDGTRYYPQINITIFENLINKFHGDKSGVTTTAHELGHAMRLLEGSTLTQELLLDRDGSAAAFGRAVHETVRPALLGFHRKKLEQELREQFQEIGRLIIGSI